MVSTEQRSAAAEKKDLAATVLYRVRFRKESPPYTVSSRLAGLLPETVVMVRTDHGLEPARIVGFAPASFCRKVDVSTELELVSIADDREIGNYDALESAEADAFQVCSDFVSTHSLRMKLVRVERFFNGSKMIFYFTAENRVDFRALVKDLVQQYRTRIEMRQIGVRHETKMLGGLGLCGREFCCSSYVDNFSSVSIKMAKEQDLPLNPNKISGVCNRLFCCLTHEYEGYRQARRKMPKPGRKIIIGDQQFLVRRQNVIRKQILAESGSGEEVVLEEEQWAKARLVKGRSEKRK